MFISSIEIINRFLGSAERDDVSEVSKIVDEGVLVDICNEKDRMALMVAAVKNNTEAPRFLLHSWAQVNKLDNDGRTAVDYAAFHNAIEVMKILLEHGASMAIQTSSTETLHSGGRMNSMLFVEWLAIYNAFISCNLTR